MLRPWSCSAGLGTLRFPRRLREPAASKDQRHWPRLVSLRGSTSPRLPWPNAKAAPCLVSRLRKPWRSCFAAPGAYGFQRPTLLATPCFPSQLREPARFAYGFALVSPRRLRSPSHFASSVLGLLACRRAGGAVPALCRRAACGVSPWRRGDLPPRPDYASPGGGLRGNSFCYSRKIVNPLPICHSREGGNLGVPY